MWAWTLPTYFKFFKKLFVLRCRASYPVLGKDSFFYRNSGEIYASSIDSDCQRRSSGASKQGLHCFCMFLIRDTNIESRWLRGFSVRPLSCRNEF